MLVDDDNGSTYETYYTDALTGAGRTCTKWTVSSQGSPTSATLSSYGIVVWFCGNDYSTTLSATDQANLTTYLNNGGKLFLSGQDIGYDIRTDSGNFMGTYLHAGYLKDDTDYTLLTGADFLTGRSDSISGTGGANNQSYPSSISAANGGTICYNYANGDGAAGVSYRNGYRVVFFSFGFEAIDSPANRIAVMQAVMGFLTAS